MILVKQTKQAFSIILAMIIVIIMLFIAYNLLDMIVPFSKNVKWIENASNAYYQSYGWLEESIYNIAKNPVWFELNKSMSVSSTWYSISMSSTWSRIPIIWNWNSEYNKDWNIVVQWEPIQLYFSWWTAVDWTKTQFYFRVPDLNRNWVNSETLSWTISDILNWQISWSWFALNSSWSSDMFSVWDINWTAKYIWSKNGIDLDWNKASFSQFYSSWSKLSNCLNFKCSLKLSIVNPLYTSLNQKIPYLEYYIIFKDSWWNIINVPEQYVDITTNWKSYWFKKTINFKYRIDTTSEAFDFTVFQ